MPQLAQQPVQVSEIALREHAPVGLKALPYPLGRAFYACALRIWNARIPMSSSVTSGRFPFMCATSSLLLFAAVWSLSCLKMCPSSEIVRLGYNIPVHSTEAERGPME